MLRFRKWIWECVEFVLEFVDVEGLGLGGRRGVVGVVHVLGLWLWFVLCEEEEVVGGRCNVTAGKIWMF